MEKSFALFYVPFHVALFFLPQLPTHVIMTIFPRTVSLGHAVKGHNSKLLLLTGRRSERNLTMSLGALSS